MSMPYCDRESLRLTRTVLRYDAHLHRKTAMQALLAALILAASAGHAAAMCRAASDVAVEVRNNESEPVLCAEKDNVTIETAVTGGPALPASRRRIRPISPGSIKDNWEADWTACDMTGDPAFKAADPAAPRHLL